MIGIEAGRWIAAGGYALAAILIVYNHMQNEDKFWAGFALPLLYVAGTYLMLAVRFGGGPPDEKAISFFQPAQWSLFSALIILNLIDLYRRKNKSR